MLAFPEISGHLLFVLLLFCDSFFLMLSLMLVFSFCSETSLCRFGKSFCIVVVVVTVAVCNFSFCKIFSPSTHSCSIISVVALPYQVNARAFQSLREFVVWRTPVLAL